MGINVTDFRHDLRTILDRFIAQISWDTWVSLARFQLLERGWAKKKDLRVDPEAPGELTRFG